MALSVDLPLGCALELDLDAPRRGREVARRVRDRALRWLRRHSYLDGRATSRQILSQGLDRIEAGLTGLGGDPT
jgi:hypothetical protein